MEEKEIKKIEIIEDGEKIGISIPQGIQRTTLFAGIELLVDGIVQESEGAIDHAQVLKTVNRAINERNNK